MKNKFKALFVGLTFAGILGAAAELLVYEPFNYTTGDPSGTGVALNGQGTTEELGLTDTWTTQNFGGNPSLANSTTVYPEGDVTGITQNNNTANVNLFDGTVDNLPTSGGFFGVSNASNVDIWTNGTDHIQAWRPLAASVTATFQTGNTTWFSLVTARGYSNNARSPSFYIGAGNLVEDRGNAATASGIGGGGGNNDGGFIFPTYWDTGLISNNGTSNPTEGFLTWTGFGTPNIMIGKIEWNADPANSGDIVSIFSFLETDTLSESAFNDGITANPLMSSVNWPTNSPTLDESTFTMISIGGGRFFADEIRIGTTFEDVTTGGAGPPPPPFAITDFSVNENILTVTWRSKAGKKYIVRPSLDLEDWSSDFDDDVDHDEDGNGDEFTTVSFDTMGTIVQGESNWFVRVDQKN